MKVDEPVTTDDDALNWYLDALNFLKKHASEEKKPKRNLRSLHRRVYMHAGLWITCSAGPQVWDWNGLR